MTRTDNALGFSGTTIRALNAAEDALGEIRRAAQDARTFESGALCNAAENARDALFEVKNIAKNLCDVPLTHAQIHNRPPEPESIA